MARLNQIDDSDDEFPELSTLLRPLGDGDTQALERASENRGGSGRCPQKGGSSDTIELGWKGMPALRNVAQLSPEEKHSSGPLPPRPLKPADINALQVPILRETLDGAMKAKTAHPFTTRSPRKPAKAQVDYSQFASRLSNTRISFSGNDYVTDLSGFIVPDSASDEETLPSRSRAARESWKTTRKAGDPQSKKYALGPIRSPFEEEESTGPIDLTSPKKGRKTSKLVCPESPPRFRIPPRMSDRDEQYSDLDQPFSKMKLFVPIIK